MRLFGPKGDTYHDHLKFLVSRTMAGILLGMLVLMAGRACFVAAFASPAFSAIPGDELASFIEVTLRFDLKYTAIALAPAFCLGLPCLTRGMRIAYRRLFWCLAFVGMFLLVLLTIINYYYYQTYQRVIDVFFFSFFREDPLAVLVTLWQDYPLLLGIISLVAGMVVLMRLHSWLGRAVAVILPVPRGRVAMGLFTLAVVGAYAVALRGSIGTFPLRQDHAQISRDATINAAVPNGPTALYWAWKWNRQQSDIPMVPESQIISDYAALGLSPAPGDLLSPLRQRTAHSDFLEGHRPDIVLSLMESMSTHMLSLDTPSRDLYASFRKHRDDPEDYFFLNFLSEGNGTMDSITRLLMAVPDLNLSTSEWGLRHYGTNIIDWFHAKGYKVIYVTCGPGTWRGIDNFFRRQGMDEVYEYSSIKKRFPEATEGAWGVDDEYLYRYALELLRAPHDQPYLMITVSITNHPPYRVPEGHEPQQVELTGDILSRFPYSDTPTIFATLRYANDQVGRFFSEIKSDPNLSGRTILALTGDHNLRGIGYAAHPAEVAFGHAVPFYLHLPSAYREHDPGIDYNPARLGSQKDIFATIAHHALSDADLVTFGCDLLGRGPCAFPFAYNADVAIPHEGGFACNIAEPFPFRSVALTEGLMADPGRTNVDGGKCELALGLSRLQRDLYHHQARAK
ncbi:MAG: LTA synthase family protein [Succinivibrionaceae bacterium]|nr:LTA synthase family protein [Succinivibrionaceae bacterium]